MILPLLSLLRTLIGIIDLILVTAILYLLSFLPKPILKNWYPALFRYWCKVFIRALRVELYVHQHYQGTLPKQYILIGNHPSAFEDIGMPALFDAKFLAKHEVKDWFIVGRIGYAAGTLYVDRESKPSRKEAFETLKDAIKKGDSVALYPEGGCKGRRLVIPFQFGAFDLAIQTATPIIPVFLQYEAQEDFEWDNEHLVYKIWQILCARNSRANYHIYDPIDPQNFTSKEALCEHVQALYLDWQKKWLD
jgi:lyso-ornithine lipid O-acyltransferase